MNNNQLKIICKIIYIYSFRQRFRLTKEAFVDLISQIKIAGHLSTSIPATLQMAATLSLLACGSFQHSVGDDFLLGMAQSTICKIVNHITKEIERKVCPKYIKFMPAESSQCKEYFMRKYKLPGGIFL